MMVLNYFNFNVTVEPIQEPPISSLTQPIWQLPNDPGQFPYNEFSFPTVQAGQHAQYGPAQPTTYLKNISNNQNTTKNDPEEFHKWVIPWAPPSLSSSSNSIMLSHTRFPTVSPGSVTPEVKDLLVSTHTLRILTMPLQMVPTTQTLLDHPSSQSSLFHLSHQVLYHTHHTPPPNFLFTSPYPPYILPLLHNQLPSTLTSLYPYSHIVWIVSRSVEGLHFQHGKYGG